VTSKPIVDQARQVLEIESEAVARLAERLDESFEPAVKLILDCDGRAIVTGVGKSGAIAQKLVGTFRSTGTAAVFLHPTEAVHGDIGVVRPRDVVIALSYSGETEEILRIVPMIKRAGAALCSLTGRPKSTLAQESDVVLNVAVEREACPLGLAPTASTTAMLAMADALAVATMVSRGFTEEDFARVHPAGALGRKLLLRVSEIMHGGDENPVVSQDDTLREAVAVMTNSPLRGIANVIDENGKLVGVFTDGDLRRILSWRENVLDLPMREVMTKNPTTIREDRLAAEAVHVLQEREFDNMPVVDSEGRAVGVIDVQDILKSGIV